MGEVVDFRFERFVGEGTEFREDIRQVLRRNGPSAEDLRALAGDFERLAARYETQEEVV